MHGFDCETISLKNANMFECIKIAETIYEGVLEPCYKKYTREDNNCGCHSRKMRE